MSFLDLPTELVRAIFEEIFHVGWVNSLRPGKGLVFETCLQYEQLFSCRRALTKHITEEFDTQVKHCGLGNVRIPRNLRRPWRRINDRLLAVILQQKVILLQESDSQLINKLRETANVLGISEERK